MIEKQSNIKDIMFLQEQINKSKGRHIFESIENLKTTFYILDSNHEKLQQLLSVCKNEKFIYNFNPHTNPQKFNAYFTEMYRLFHNFVAAAKTLIDHTRQHIDDLYSTTPFYQEYQTKLKSTISDIPVRIFIQDLRNYTLHKTLPLTQATYTLKPREQNQLSLAITLDVKKLKEWDKWKSKALEYINQSKSNISIAEICDEYFKLINVFYNWLATRESEINKTYLDETNKLIDHYNEMMKARNLNGTDQGFSRC